MRITMTCFYPELRRSQWLKCLQQGGSNLSQIKSRIDTKGFFAQSYKGASLFSAYNKGVSLNDILKAGDWTNADNFLNHYYAHASDTQ